MIDTIAIIESNLIERITMRNAETSFLLLEEGRKTEASDVSTHYGGGAMNAAVAMARLGIDSAALVKLGKDARADSVLQHFADEHVSTDWVVQDERMPTGAAVHIASHDRDAAIFTFRGANRLLEASDLRDDAFAVDLVYISSLSDGSADCFPLMIEKAKAHGATVAANPGIRQLSVRGSAFFDCLRKIDILTLNRVEADALVPQLVSRIGEGSSSLSSKSDKESPALVVRGFVGGGYELTFSTFVRTIVDLGPRYLVITDGRFGAYVGSDRRLIYCPVLPTEVAGTAGAGDAFASTFASFIMLGSSLDDAVRAATVNAASVLTRIDTQGGLLGLEEIKARLRALHAQLELVEWTPC